MKQGNHMVDLPQEETAVNCAHFSPPRIEEIEDFDETCITFIVVCQDCGEKGYVGSTIDLGMVEWG